MGVQIERKAASTAATPADASADTRVTLQIIHAFMTSAVGAFMTVQGLKLGHDPTFMIGGAAAGSAIAIGGLATLLGVGWLITLAWRKRRARPTVNR